MLALIVAMSLGGALFSGILVHNRLIRRRELCDEAWHNLLAQAHAWKVLGDEAVTMRRRKGPASYVPVQCAESGLQAALRRYNQCVFSYNGLAGSFPSKWLAEWADGEVYEYANLREGWLTGGPPSRDGDLSVVPLALPAHAEITADP